MDDNKNQNQPNFSATDYQKILDQYAASVKPEDSIAEEENKPEVDLNITTSLKEAPPTSEENKIPEIKPDITESIPSQSTETFLKSVNSPQLESPIHPSLAANLESEEEDYPAPAPFASPESNLAPPQPPLNIEQAPEPEKSPEEIKAEINRLLTEDNSTQTPSSSVTSATSSGNHRFPKIFFIISLVLFLGIVIALAYFLFLPSSDKSSSNTKTSSVTPTIVEENDTIQTSSDGNCQLNGNTYSIGESFKSADGCNTCNCSSAGVIACTEMACSLTPTTSSSATNSSSQTSNSTEQQKEQLDAQSINSLAEILNACQRSLASNNVYPWNDKNNSTSDPYFSENILNETWLNKLETEKELKDGYVAKLKTFLLKIVLIKEKETSGDSYFCFQPNSQKIKEQAKEKCQKTTAYAKLCETNQEYLCIP